MKAKKAAKKAAAKAEAAAAGGATSARPATTGAGSTRAERCATTSVNCATYHRPRRGGVETYVEWQVGVAVARRGLAAACGVGHELRPVCQSLGILFAAQDTARVNGG